jgi:hypothetical protein
MLSLMLTMVWVGDVLAQASTQTSQDSICGGTVRPRRDSYLIQAFPSPAKSGETVLVQYYNHNPEEISIRVVDVLDRLVTPVETQPRTFTANGLHSFGLSTRGLASGMYFIRLTSYTSAGAVNQIDESRFLILH